MLENALRTVGRGLLLDTSPGAGLASVRSLGSAGFAVAVARLGHESVAEHSRFCRRTVDLGDPMTDVRSVRARLMELLHRHAYHLMIPVTDAALEVCAAIRPQLERAVRVAMPPAAAYEYAHDKAKLLDLAAMLGIPVPSSVTLRNLDDVHT